MSASYTQTIRDLRDFFLYWNILLAAMLFPVLHPSCGMLCLFLRESVV